MTEQAIDAEFTEAKPTGGNQTTALVRMVGQEQMAIAVQRPRDLAKIKENLFAELQAFPDMAEAAIYIKPIGTKTVNADTRDERDVMTFHRDLSVRAAEAMEAHWDNHAMAVEVQLTEDGAHIVGYIYDFQANVIKRFDSVISRYVTKRGGNVERLSDDRFELKMKAERSKLKRDMILQSVPGALSQAYAQEAKRLVLDKKDGEGKPIPPERQLEALVKWFKKTHSVERVNLHEVLGHEPGRDVVDDLMMLLGIANIIREERMPVSRIFGIVAKPNMKKAETKKGGSEINPVEATSQMESK
jgi:hypothetical protein